MTLQIPTHTLSTRSTLQPLLPAVITALLLLFCMSVKYASSDDKHQTYCQTQYPIVLVHGLFGFKQLLGMDYFFGISHALTRSGATVFTASVSNSHSNEHRGEQLLTQVQWILAVTGTKKVNLIGHSQGAPTIRYVASVRPDLVASVTSIGGVNKGSKVADKLVLYLEKHPSIQQPASKLMTAFSKFIDLLSGNQKQPQDSLATLNALTTKGLNQFNVNHPEGIADTYCGKGRFLADNGVYYYSWTGSANVTNLLDPGDIFLAIMGRSFNEPNDGLVATCSSHLGRVIGDSYKMNHLDEINGLLGIHHLFETDPVTLYRQHANRLKRQGL